MKEIITFIITNPAYAIIIALVIIIAIREIGIKNILGLIRGTQKEKYPKLEMGQIEIMKELHKQNQVLAQQNQTFLENHSLHEIPHILGSVDRIEKTLDSVVEIQRVQGLDIATLKERSLK